MNKPRLPHELSLEDLLKAASTEDKSGEVSTPATSSDGSISSFIQAFKLLPGKHLVPGKTLYRLFTTWTGGSHIGLVPFSTRLSEFFPSKRAFRGLVCFLVNQDINQLLAVIANLKEKRTRRKSTSRFWQSHFTKFLSDTGIAAGSVFVEADVLYFVYRRWNRETRKKLAIGYEQFKEICELQFEVRKTSEVGMPWYGVNGKIKELITREEVKFWRKGRNGYGSKVKEKNGKQKEDPKVEKGLYTKKAHKKKRNEVPES